MSIKTLSLNLALTLGCLNPKNLNTNSNPDPNSNPNPNINELAFTISQNRGVDNF